MAKPSAPAPAKAAAPVPARAAAAPRAVSTLDLVLAVIAMIVGIGAVLSVASLMFGPWALN